VSGDKRYTPSPDAVNCSPWSPGSPATGADGDEDQDGRAGNSQIRWHTCRCGCHRREFELAGGPRDLSGPAGLLPSFAGDARQPPRAMGCERMQEAGRAARQAPQRTRRFPCRITPQKRPSLTLSPP
jgi:hypothetical protein